MFTRVLSKPFFLRRGSQTDPPAKATKNAGASSASRDGCKVHQSTADNTRGTLTGGADIEDPPRLALVNADENDTRRFVFQPFRDPFNRAPVILDNMSCMPQTGSNSVKQQEEPSGSSIFKETTNGTTKPESIGQPTDSDNEESDDEDYGTPLIGTMDGPFTPIFHDAGDGVASSPISPTIPQYSFAAGAHPTQTGLSDITETEEPISIQTSPKLQSSESSNFLQTGRRRGLSFSSFGSSYPSTPHLGDVAIVSALPRTRCACGRLQEQTEHITRIASPENTSGDMTIPILSIDGVSTQYSSMDISKETEPGDRSRLTSLVAHCSNLSEVLPIASGAVEGKVCSEVPPSPDKSVDAMSISPSTYADVMNLALQHPKEAATILQHPLTSTPRLEPPASSHQDNDAVPPPRPAISSPPVVSKSSSTRSVQDICGMFDYELKRRLAAPHTADRPNWALAPDEPPAASYAKTNRRSNSRGRGKGNTNQRPPSDTLSGGQSRGRSRRCSDAMIKKVVPTSSVSVPLIPTLHAATAKDVEDDNERTGFTLTSAVALIDTQDVQDGPELWLERVNSWMEQTPATASLPPADFQATAGSTLPPLPEAVSVSADPMAPVVSPAPEVPSVDPVAMPLPVSTTTSRLTDPPFSAAPSMSTSPLVCPTPLATAVPAAQASMVPDASSESVPSTVMESTSFKPSSGLPGGLASHPAAADATSKSLNRTRANSKSSASGLNPLAPVWEPRGRSRTQTTVLSVPSEAPSCNGSPSFGPTSRAVDTEIERLREMLRNCGLQDKEEGELPSRSPAPPSTIMLQSPSVHDHSKVSTAEIKVENMTGNAGVQGLDNVRQPGSKQPTGFLDAQGRLHRETARPVVVHASQGQVCPQQPFTTEVHDRSRPLPQTNQRLPVWIQYARPDIGNGNTAQLPTGFFRLANGGAWIGGCVAQLPGMHTFVPPHPGLGLAPAGPSTLPPPPHSQAETASPGTPQRERLQPQCSPSPAFPGAYRHHAFAVQSPLRPPPSLNMPSTPSAGRTRQLTSHPTL